MALQKAVDRELAQEKFQFSGKKFSVDTGPTAPVAGREYFSSGLLDDVI
jgi:hypothetical protein